MPSAIVAVIGVLLDLQRAQGEWVAVAPESVARTAAVLPGIRTLDLVEPEVHVPVALAQLADEPRSPVAVAIEFSAFGWRPGGVRETNAMI